MTAKMDTIVCLFKVDGQLYYTVHRLDLGDSIEDEKTNTSLSIQNLFKLGAKIECCLPEPMDGDYRIILNLGNAKDLQVIKTEHVVFEKELGC